MEFIRLFEPIEINGMRIPNRIVMPAMALFYAENYSFSDRFKAFYRERARGGVGLMIMGPMAIDKVGSNPLMPGLFEDEQIGPLKLFIDELHRESETRIGTQLMHLGRYASSRVTGVVPIAPSAIASPINGEVPREMTADDIGEVQDAFVSAALRAKDAGFDYVEIMAAGGYLIGEFLSPVTNHRTDEYGGSEEKRMRFGLEVIEKVRRVLGKDLPLGIRVSGQDFMRDGNTLMESAIFCGEAERAGVDCINVTGGWHETDVPQITVDVPPGAYVHLAYGIKRKVSVPVFASNRLGDPRVSERVLRSGVADMVCWGRPLIADPDLPGKAKAGRLDEIVPCIACNQGCLDSIFSGLSVCCTVNPRAGREADSEVLPTKKKRRIYVAGGGPAGLQFSLTARQRGHLVTLYEKADKLGGQVNCVGAVPGKEEFLGAVKSLEARAKAAGVEVKLGTELTLEMVRKDPPDLLIVASGAEPGSIRVPGINGPNVVSAWDILNGTVSHIGRNIVIAGGGATGCETALYLANLAVPSATTISFLAFHEAEGLDKLRDLLYDSGRTITIIEIAERAAANVGASTRWSLLKGLGLMRVDLRLGTRLLNIEPDTVSVENESGMESIPADTVVIATGSRPVHDLAQAGKEMGIETITIGDAKEPRKILDAIREGFDAALGV